MIIVFSKDGAKPRFVPSASCLEFYRAFRDELWRAGHMRDPKVGDELLGVKIIAITL